MKLSLLLLQREALLRQTRLANLAFVYRHLGSVVARISRAQLRGEVCLQLAEPAAERYWPVLTAREGNQSVIEEHFTDANILELADLIGFITGKAGVDTTFRLENMAAEFLAPLEQKLEEAGVELEPEKFRLPEPNER